ncbi:MAG TPA: MAPEG family protein [Rhodocyclaceae bacterium]|nr:MAPEG family protein [Rhodocyclaceae bacterium]
MSFHHPVLWPVVGMVLITFVTWLRMYFERIGEMRKRRISAQRIASRQAATVLEATRAADHFANLFELPVLFYVLCVCLIITGMESGVFITGAWGYLALRGLHTAIHLTYNRVMHRFMAYVASSLVLFLMWMIFAWQLAVA